MVWPRDLRAREVQRPPREPPTWGAVNAEAVNISQTLETRISPTMMMSSFPFVPLGRLVEELLVPLEDIMWTEGSQPVSRVIDAETGGKGPIILKAKDALMKPAG